jgi:lactate dehydrogenase-like 2-hydroxyacid dehydrogenase
VLLNKEYHPDLHHLAESACDITLAPDMAAWADAAGPAAAAAIQALLVHGHARVDAALLARFPNLRCVSNHGVGIDHIRVPDCTAAGVVVCNTPDVLSPATADLAFALLLAGARRVVQGDALARDPATTAFSGTWFGKDVAGATLGVVGLGSIGREIARRGALGFGMRVLYHTRNRAPPDVEAALGGATHCAGLDELLAQADFVVLAVPATPETRHLMGARQLAAMRPGAVLVNIGRGCLVDQDAVVAALAQGRLGHYATDVTEPEPLPRDHPLLGLRDRTTITPHVGSATLGARGAMLRLLLENLAAVMAGRTPRASPNYEQAVAVRAARAAAGEGPAGDSAAAASQVTPSGP